MTQVLYSVRDGRGAVDLPEDEAREELAHAIKCEGCAGVRFHREDVYGMAGLTLAEVFPVRLPTGATLYPSSAPLLPLAERVAYTLDVVRRAYRKASTPTMVEHLAERIRRLSAYQD